MEGQPRSRLQCQITFRIAIGSLTVVLSTATETGGAAYGISVNNSCSAGCSSTNPTIKSSSVLVSLRMSSLSLLCLCCHASCLLKTLWTVPFDILRFPSKWQLHPVPLPYHSPEKIYRVGSFSTGLSRHDSTQFEIPTKTVPAQFCFKAKSYAKHGTGYVLFKWNCNPR